LSGATVFVYVPLTQLFISWVSTRSSRFPEVESRDLAVTP
jgi:hypothetical protein